MTENMMWIPMAVVGFLAVMLVIAQFMNPRQNKELVELTQNLHWLKALTIRQRAEDPEWTLDVPEEIMRTTHDTLQTVYLKGYFFALSQVVNQVKLNPRDILDDWAMIEATLLRYDEDLEEADNQNNPISIPLKNSPSTKNK